MSTGVDLPGREPAPEAAAAVSTDDSALTTSEIDEPLREPWSITAARFALPVILLIFIIFFSLARPDEFFTTGNLKTIASTQSVLAILALACILPLIIGEFDISVGANLGLGGILVTGFVSNNGFPVVVAIVLAVLGCTLVGLFNGVLVAKLGITSIVATLGVASIITGSILWYTEGSAIFERIPSSLTALGQNEVLGIPLPVFYLIVIAFVTWYILEQTPVGRYLYALGGSKEASRLSGLNVNRLSLVAFTTTGFLAGVAGVISSAKLGSGNPNVGPPYLLPAFAAAFLGATAIKPGTYNVVGTIVAVFTIATGVIGLQLMGVPFFVEPIFTGASLIIAVAATRFLRREAL